MADADPVEFPELVVPPNGLEFPDAGHFSERDPFGC